MPDGRIAYFSMEIGLESAMPTYSGGLGVLAGDTIRAVADRELPLVAVTLLHRKGYFRQELEENGEQKDLAEEWEVRKTSAGDVGAGLGSYRRPDGKRFGRGGTRSKVSGATTCRCTPSIRISPITRAGIGRFPTFFTEAMNATGYARR